MLVSVSVVTGGLGSAEGLLRMFGCRWGGLRYVETVVEVAVSVVPRIRISLLILSVVFHER